jgi:hypothetical protein
MEKIFLMEEENSVKCGIRTHDPLREPKLIYSTLDHSDDLNVENIF